MVFRILLASIRNLGEHPCPRCLIPLSHAHRFGMPLDRKQRSRLAHQDTVGYRAIVSGARNVIYMQYHGVESKHVTHGLSAYSAVPISVRLIEARSSCFIFLSDASDRMHFQKSWPPMGLICFPPLWLM